MPRVAGLFITAEFPVSYAMLVPPSAWDFVPYPSRFMPFVAKAAGDADSSAGTIIKESFFRNIPLSLQGSC